MATHFARGILTEGHLISVRLPSQCHQEARNIPPHRQSRFLASRGLLAELMFMLYGIGELPEIVTLPKGKPVFSLELSNQVQRFFEVNFIRCFPT